MCEKHSTNRNNFLAETANDVNGCNNCNHGITNAVGEELESDWSVSTTPGSNNDVANNKRRLSIAGIKSDRGSYSQADQQLLQSKRLRGVYV